MPNLPITRGCTGCGACAQTCTKQAIVMREDKEGFLSPQIDTTKCTECGLCEKRCHVLHKPEHDISKQRTLAVINERDRMKSSSGGAFSLFARMVLSKGGVVFGAAFAPFPHLKHIGIDRLEDLDKLRGSKYVQSEIGDSYKQTKALLKAGTMVLYTGTPCQIGGLYAYLGGDRYDSLLITLDLVCHGVPNEATFKAYLEKLEKSKSFGATKTRNIGAFRFRNLDSWDYRPAIQVTESESWHILDQETNVFMSAFFRGSIYRESCFHCPYANCDRIGTYTIADFWGIGTQGRKFSKNVAAGVSLVLDNEGRWESMKGELGKNDYAEERTLEEAKAKNGNLNGPVKRTEERDTAIADMMDPDMSLMAYARKYNMLDSQWKHLIKKTFKDIIYGLHLYNIYKSISYKLGKTS